MQTQLGEEWHYLGKSVRGAQHLRLGIPNQDHWNGKDVQETSALMIAVADGHGSPQACRSDKGAQFAVDAALEVLSEYLCSDSVRKGQWKLEPTALPTQIVKRWRDLVGSDHSQRPLTEVELNAVVAAAGLEAREKLLADQGFVRAYGSTLLASLLTQQFLLCLQLGDGDILVVPRLATSAQRLFARDEGLIANETTSLCQAPQDAIGAFHVTLTALAEGEGPSLIFLATDGYSNSFKTSADFERVPVDLLTLLKEDGQKVVEEKLPGWLEDASANGSGDDVTVAIMWASTRRGS